MAIHNENPFVYFILSDIQIKEDTDIAEALGKKYKEGNVFTGNSGKRYSKLITEDNLVAMSNQYPDMSVVAKGFLNTFKYTEPEMS